MDRRHQSRRFATETRLAQCERSGRRFKIWVDRFTDTEDAGAAAPVSPWSAAAADPGAAPLQDALVGGVEVAGSLSLRQRVKRELHAMGAPAGQQRATVARRDVFAAN